jgi:peptide/nickel transport system substrate-binding protein
MHASRRSPTWVAIRLMGIAAVAALALGLAAHRADGHSAAAASRVGVTARSAGSHSTITVAISSPPTSLDPAKNNNTADSQLLEDLAYEPLIYLSSSGKLTPGLATSWKFTDSRFKTFQLTLRNGAEFSDGQPVTAQAVVASIQHEKTANGPVAIYVNAIKSAVAINSHTVQLKLVQSNPYIGLLLTQRFLIGDIVGPSGTSNPATLGTSTDGAGPYMLDASASVAGDHYTFVPNPHYWDQAAINFKTFVVRVITNPQTTISALQSGQIAYADGSFTTVTQAKSDGLQVFSTPSSWYALFLFDRGGTLVPALKSQLVRQAINYAVNRKAIASALFDGYGIPDDEVSVPGYEQDGYATNYANRYPYDPAKAKQLLAKAGYAHGFTMTVGATPSPSNGVELAQAVAGYLAKVGITVKVQSYADLNDLLGPWSGAKLPVVAWYYDTQPLYITYSQAVTKDAGLFNPFKSSDTELNKLAQKAYNTTSAAKLPAAWAAVQRRIDDLGWFVSLVDGDSLYYGAKGLSGAQLSPTAFVPDPTQFKY